MFAAWYAEPVHAHHREQSAGHRPRAVGFGEQGANRTQHRDQGEGADAADGRAGALAFQADQGAKGRRHAQHLQGRDRIHVPIRARQRRDATGRTPCYLAGASLAGLLCDPRSLPMNAPKIDTFALTETLPRCGQSHLLAHLATLEGAPREAFAQRLAQIDWEELREHAAPPTGGAVGASRVITFAERDQRADELEAAGDAAYRAGQVAVLAGAQCGLFSVAQCLLDAGDEVIVIDPTYVTYEGVFGACGAQMVKVAARPEDGFVARVQDIEAAITRRTRMLVVNSPHNPTGAVVPHATWLRIAELCIRHDLWLVSDEVYSELVFEGEHTSPASLPGMDGRTATINSLSKSHAMTGWRVGWVVGPQELIAHLGRLSLCMLYGCPPFIQLAACVALESELPALAQMRSEYRLRRDAVCEALRDAPGVAVFRPPAGMFVMVDIRATGHSAQQFAEQLLRQHSVSVLPGDPFGSQAAGYLRLGLVEPAPVLQEACRRIRVLAQHLLAQQPAG